jgi:hypothetical protein
MTCTSTRSSTPAAVKALFALTAYCVICTLSYSRLAEEDAAVARAYDVDMTQIAVAATAVFGERAAMVEISLGGYLIGVRPLSAAACHSDSQTLEARVKLVASAAHHRYLGATDGSYPTTKPVAAAEL